MQHTDLLIEAPAPTGQAAASKTFRWASLRGKQPRRHRGSRLIEQFSEFLAERNVINQTSRRYDKMLASQPNEDEYEDEHPIDRLSSSTGSSSSSSSLGGFNSLSPGSISRHHQHHLHRQHQAAGGSGKRVLLLLRALVSRKQKNRSLLVVRLLRAPAVLAALFSLALVATLLVLYTMNFHAHNCRLEHEQQLLMIANSHQASGSKPSEAAELLRLHRISSRQLPLGDDNDDQRQLIVQTECGQALGKLDGGAHLFEGIPYASPPIGGRRWRRPRPVWADEQLCRPNVTMTSPQRSHCAQLSPVKRRFTGSEDCLYLDVYAPAVARRNQTKKKLPVMVYIHGGFLTFGSSGEGEVNWMKARPSGQLASELQVVLVAFNYRLQALGFMSLLPPEPLSKQPKQNASSLDLGERGELRQGNYGLWDQLAALRWVKRNIGHFGGDPENIVLFGPDSASSLPLALLARNKEEDQEDLFRAVWLANPTLFYQLPQELASQHYQRLFLNQSPCLEIRGAKAAEGDSDRNQLARMLECLMELSAEQVVRHYLGQDDPSYRLDDQNSLPIHGIFADQFVAVDRDLVRDSYPFGRPIISHEPPLEPSKSSLPPLPPTVAAAEAANATNERQTSAAHYRPLGGGGEVANAASDPRGPAGPNEERPAPAGGRADNYHNCLGGGARGLVCGHQKDLLLGSSAQAVEYWPCPRNLNQWAWADFKRYVATSLNSFVSDTYERACDLYRVPSGGPELAAKANGTSSKQSGGPKETYLSMVSDIRQTCPINELADSMRARGHRVRRYIVETPYSGGSGYDSGANSSTSSANSSLLPEFAFHTWDLMAFFGFHFDPNFSPNNKDLKFQRHIRQMVSEFVHNNDNKPSSGPAGGYLLFNKEAQTEQVPRGKHKEDECRMWHAHLGRSYAWVS